MNAVKLNTNMHTLGKLFCTFYWKMKYKNIDFSFCTLCYCPSDSFAPFFPDHLRIWQCIHNENLEGKCALLLKWCHIFLYFDFRLKSVWLGYVCMRFIDNWCYCRWSRACSRVFSWPQWHVCLHNKRVSGRLCRAGGRLQPWQSLGWLLAVLTGQSVQTSPNKMEHDFPWQGRWHCPQPACSHYMSA